MLIRKANIEDLDEIVNVHMLSFKGFFLTNMGRPFLKLLYQGFIRLDNGVIRVVEMDNKIVGFSAGTVAPNTFFSELKNKNWLSFVFASIFGVVSSPIVTLKKLYSALFYKGDIVGSIENGALLSSIAILPSHSGNSIGSELLKDFENYISSLNINSHLYLTTDKYNNERVVSFYKNAGFHIDSEFFQSGHRAMYRFVKKL